MIGSVILFLGIVFGGVVLLGLVGGVLYFLGKEGDWGMFTVFLLAVAAMACLILGLSLSAAGI